MRHTLLVILGVLVVGATAFGAPAFGIKSGINSAAATYDPEGGLEVKRRAGLMLGGVIEFPVNDKGNLRLRGELLYVQKGWELEEPLFGLSSDVEVDELVIAPFFVVRFPSGNLAPFLQIGAELGANLRAEVLGLDIENWQEVNNCLNLGGGLAIPSGTGELVLDARLNVGMTDMNGSDNDVTITTNGIQFMLGYHFGSSKK